MTKYTDNCERGSFCQMASSEMFGQVYQLVTFSNKSLATANQHATSSHMISMSTSLKTTQWWDEASQKSQSEKIWANSSLRCQLGEQIFPYCNSFTFFHITCEFDLDHPYGNHIEFTSTVTSALQQTGRRNWLHYFQIFLFYIDVHPVCHPVSWRLSQWNVSIYIKLQP